ncbi:2-Hydroxyacid oxidase 1-like [Ptychodera flava]|uniref:2-Hydroxyacid oxidase 1-like n=1 Tax=Ptychodera flava TaxID=63121 RepID=UPI00396A18E6
MELITAIVLTLMLAVLIHFGFQAWKKRMLSKMMARHMKPGLFTLNEYEEYARKHLPRHIFSYFTDGAGDQSTMRRNKAAFNRYYLQQRVLTDIGTPDLSTTVLGNKVAIPLGFSPVLRKNWAWKKGDLCSAEAAGKHGICDVVPVYSESSMEEIAACNPQGLRWLQIYICKDESIMAALVRRAEAAGYKAIVVSIDCHWKRFVYSDWKNMIFKYLIKTSHGNFNGENFIKAYSQNVAERASWKSITRLTQMTKLPIVVKGVMSADDAVLAAQCGVKGVIVSNHGGRMMESLPASIEVLNEVVTAVRDKLEVYIDGGVRSGTDIIKALALGAKACFIGRPVLYGLCFKGEEGVSQILSLLREDLERVMLCTGCASVTGITPSVIRDRHAPRSSSNVDCKCFLSPASHE